MATIEGKEENNGLDNTQGDKIPLQKRVFEVIDGEKASKAVNGFLVILIILNVIAVIASSIDNIHERYERFLTWFEYFSVAIFTIEYLLRFWTAKYLFPKDKHPYLKYITSGMAIIDLLAILPFYVQFIFIADLRFLRLFRLVRILRVLKLIRYYNSLGLITKVLKTEKEKLIITFIFIIILLLVSSSAMYFIENDVQPDKFPNIPATLWWAVASLTTVGYGDVYPITVWGKMLAGIISVLAIGLVALPSGIISAGLIKQFKRGEFISNPGDIYGVLNLIEEISKYSKTVINNVLEELDGRRFGIGKTQHKDYVYGTYIIYRSDDNIFFGLSSDLCSSGDEDKEDYAYCLKIWESYIINENYEKWLEEKGFSCIHDKGWIYIKIDRKLFLDETQEKKLRKMIVDIIENFFPVIQKESLGKK